MISEATLRVSRVGQPADSLPLRPIVPQRSSRQPSSPQGGPRRPEVTAPLNASFLVGHRLDEGETILEPLHLLLLGKLREGTPTQFDLAGEGDRIVVGLLVQNSDHVIIVNLRRWMCIFEQQVMS